MFTKYLWLLDNSKRKKAILKSYRFSLKQLSHLQDHLLIFKLKQILTQQLHQNKFINKIDLLSEEFQSLQAFNYILVESQKTNQQNTFIAKLIRLAYFQAFFQKDTSHAPYLMSKLEQFPQYVALKEKDQKYYKYLVQQSVKRQNLPEWQKYKQLHEYLVDKKSEKLDQRIPLDVEQEDLDSIEQIIRQKDPYWIIYYNIFEDILSEKFKHLKKEAKQQRQPEPVMPTPTYKWKPFNQMYKLRKNEWVYI